MIVGSLVKYKNKYTSEDLIGIILEICYEAADWCPYKVRWVDHTSSQRDWYQARELELLS
jgi:hypothetical protein